MRSSLVTLIIALLAIIAGMTLGQKVRSTAPDPIVIEVVKPATTHATSTTPDMPDAPASTWTYADLKKIEEDVVVGRIEVTMKNAPIETLHHMSLFAAGTPDALCGTSTHAGIDELYTASRNNVREPVVFEEPYGLHLKAGTLLGVEFMEHTRHEPHGPGGDYENHTLVVTLYPVADPMKHPIALDFIRPQLDDTPCQLPNAHQAFEVPPGAGSFTRTSRGPNDGAYTFPVGGSILLRGANLWPDKGGKALSVYINDTLKETFVPTRLEQPWLWSIPTRAEPLRVEKDDVLTIAATYENPFPAPIKDASGIFGFYFAPEVK